MRFPGQRAECPAWRSAAALLLTLILATPVAARDSLGVFDGWAAFRDTRPPRCYAIAQPRQAVPADARWQPFASVAVWPTLRQRTQVHIRLRRPAKTATLSIGRTRFALVAGGADAWAADPQMDAAIVAAMRSAPTMTVSAAGVRDAYRLRGAATAIDAAAIGCARR